MARPRKNIDPEQVEKLAALGMKNTEIGDFFNADEGTIRKRFSEQLTKGRARRRAKLRELQWRSAESGNVAMLIFLGKNELGQSDKQEIEQTVTVRDNPRRVLEEVFGGYAGMASPVPTQLDGRSGEVSN